MDSEKWSRALSRMKAVAFAGMLAGLCCGIASAQQRTPSKAEADITGLWLVQDPGSGSFGAFMNGVPKPELKPEIIKENEAAAADAEKNIFHNLNDHSGCTEGGNFPLMMASSPPLNIVQSKDEVFIGAESGRARFIYTDGRQHQDIKSPEYQATGFGDSIGHWEGDVLVVDTIGFPHRMCGGRTPYLETPGGGRALPTTHLTERYEMSSDRQFLTITYTWDDPAVYLKPHTYSYKYKYLEGAAPFESEDSARDASYQQRLQSSTVPPPQK